MRTYLVTGGAGFIGSNYIHYMFQKYDNEIRIINVDKLTYAGNLENLKDIENRDNYIHTILKDRSASSILQAFSASTTIWRIRATSTPGAKVPSKASNTSGIISIM